MYWVKRLVPYHLLVIICLLLLSMFTSKAITAISEDFPQNNRHTIIIDAGHGGVDGGTTSCSGKLESNFNLEIATRLNDLMNLLGYRTKMIRTDDRSIHTRGESIAAKKISDLKERVRIVNETEQAILISIHQNYFPEARYKGAQVFYSADAESRQLAETIQKSLVNCLNKGSNRSIKKGEGIYLLENIKTCGVLIECGFISNPIEELMLCDPGYQKKLSSVIGCTLSRFITESQLDHMV